MLEPYEGKPSRTVLRGLETGNGLRLLGDLTRSMVYYRLSQKLNWLLEKVGRKWKLKKGALQIIIHFLKMMGEVEYLLDEMENATVRAFGIRGIITTEKMKTGQTQEIEGIQSYNSP